MEMDKTKLVFVQDWYGDDDHETTMVFENQIISSEKEDCFVEISLHQKCKEEVDIYDYHINKGQAQLIIAYLQNIFDL